jgi:hypothetical protein
MKKIKITCTLLLLAPLLCFSQIDTNITPSKKELRKSRPNYFGLSSGFNYSSIRDFATSPLIYTGVTNYLALSRLKYNLKREAEIGFYISSGQYNNSFNEQFTSSSFVNTFAINYSQLYEFNKLSSEKLNVKIGGVFNMTSNLRVNESLLNNAVGIESFITLLGSIKITKDISRKKEVDKKFLFIKYKLKQKTRNLAFRLNIGLINSTLRNGFVYSGQSFILNDPNIFDGYQFKLFSGFRMSSALDYTIHLKNKNKIQLSYLWDAYKTGGNLDKFEMANHTFRVTLLFNTNNK